MPHVTRRRFLRYLAAGLGSVAGGPLLSACQPASAPVATATQAGATQAASAAPAKGEPTQPGLTQTPRPATSAPTEAAPAEAPSALPQPTAGLPDLVVARGGEPEDLVRRAIAALGGMEQFVQPGNDVIVKPNMCVAYHTYEYAATTNPWVVAALVKLCLEAGAKRVRVLDYPFGGSVEQAYAKSGVEEQVLAAGGEMERVTRLKFAATPIPAGVDLREVALYSEILSADVVINVPIAKTHGLARLTLGMKNLMGVIRDRDLMHRNLGQRLADLAGLVRPALTVVDAVRILTANGPTGGNLDDVKKLDTVIASRDIVAADSYAASSLFGLRPDDLDYVRAGTAAGLGRSDLGSLKIEEVAVGG